MSAALTLAIYILCCRETGEVPAFPGNKYFWNSVDDSSYAPSIADMSLWAATGEQTKNESFVHTSGDVIVWKHFWPKLTGYYGVEVRENSQLAVNLQMRTFTDYYSSFLKRPTPARLKGTTSV